MDIDELRTVQSKERRKDSLQHLRDSFYDDVAAYIADRRGERDDRAASVDNPFSDSRVRKLSDEIETAEEVAESLYERRVGKVVKLASFSAADAPVDTEGMTTQELDLFEDLVARIRENKESVLDVLADGPGAGTDADPTPDTAHEGAAAGDAGTTASADAAVAEDDAGDLLADAMGGAPDTGSGTADGEAGEDDRAAPAGEAPPTADDPVPDRPTPPDDPPGGSDGRTAERPAGGPGDATPDGSTRGATGERASGEGEPAPTPGEAGTTGDRSSGDTTESDAFPDATGSDASDTTDTTDAGDGRTTVRITRDVGSILGVDEREYDLESEDVVSLPAANADPLVERNAAEPLGEE